MADMPGESQEEPSVMVIAIRCDDPLTSLAEMSSAPPQVARNSSVALVTQQHTRAANDPSDLFVENQRVKVLLRC